MPISRKTAAEYAADLESSILSRNANYDTKIGPVSDIFIQPTANVLELQNERIRKVQQLLSLVNDGSFTDADLDAFVYNESLIRLNGTKAKVTLTFSRTTAPTTNITIKANFPVATLADEQTGVSITFLTLEDTTLDASNASAYFNNITQKYELQIVAEAVTGSSLGNVGPNRIVRALRPLNGFDAVTNTTAAIGGKDKETNSELIERYLLSLMGTSPSVVDGIKKIVRDQFPDVADSNIVYGNDALNARAASDSGAVDVYIIGESPVLTSETIIFTGVEQTIKLSHQPVISISSAGAYTPGTDYVLVKDTTNASNSTRASDGIKWLSTGTAPVIGTPVVVSYIYNGLVQQLQTSFLSTDKSVPGMDILFKEAEQVDITLSANLRVRTGFNVTLITDTITQAISDFINALRLGDDVELSDLQAVVRAFSGVDNFIITNIAKLGSTGTSDVLINTNQYARIADVDLIITVI